MAVAVTEVQENLADNAALVAENAAKDEVIKSEREANDKLQRTMEEYILKSNTQIALLQELSNKKDEEIKLLKDLVSQRDEEINRLKSKAKIEGIENKAIGVVIGGALSLVIRALL